MRSYRKKRDLSKNTLTNLSADELLEFIQKNKRMFPKKLLLSILMLSIALPVFFICNKITGESYDVLEDDGVAFTSAPIGSAAVKKDLISIPAGTVKANPFLPYRDISGNSVSDVPKYDLVAPPEVVNENSDAARVMDTIVSGILYDKFSPSAILNIEGNDYLVKKGDVVNNYRVLNILQDSVTVKLGSNVYKAGIGEILTEGTVTHNDVSNLSKKFGGERR